MSSIHEPSAQYAEPTEQLPQTEDIEVAIKFLSKKATTIEVKASKEKLIAGSGYFAAHWLEHPRSTVIKAPKFIVPGVTITQHSIDAAIAHLHGYNAPSGNAADAVELILLARAFGISTLEVIACGHIEKALERSFKVEGLADAVREFYGAYREDPFCDVGNDVVGVVIGVVARCCRKRWGILRAGPGFRLLCKDFPELMEDILDVVAEEDERGGKVVKAEELPQDSTQEFAE